jgi:hypothetical protein
MAPNNEPKRLRQGKEYHEKIQKEWLKSAEGQIEIEKWMTKRSGRKGRMDIFVISDEKLAAIAEVKRSDWDAMTLTNVRRNVSRQVRQIWDYIESQLELGKDVSSGVLFRKRPKDADRMRLIERLFNEKGIAIVWKDETVAERKAQV